ncbi:hypothetical protein [Gracilibacillus alcaliphilus]|uniref:hypothetical protein n=1 Tax=Gracilibacillus alcaliphilus TaxID=1401441 RepID=UPI001959EE88|nr:hypothetical protein [Gracilibacillus alcaliphilus]MBM7678394.1 Zn-finger nucleic acid-binding protein [Gracilibacillus alcaliphilus]
MADNKSCEVKKGRACFKCLVCSFKDTIEVDRGVEILPCPKCKGAFVDIWHAAKHIETKRERDKLKVNINVSDALKGLKAVQREARKATAAVKELEEAYNKIKPLAGHKPRTMVFDEMHATCHQCGSSKTTLHSLGDNVKGVKLICDDCGWDYESNLSQKKCGVRGETE